MLSSAIVLSVFVTYAAADLGKSVLFPNGLHDPLSGLDNIKAPGGSYYGISVPSVCSSAAPSLNCDASTIDAVYVTYDDCSQPWTVCRCSNANLDMNTLLVRFGQVPPGLRSYVGTLLHSYTATGSEWAYSSGGLTAINGDCPVSVFLHESAHHLDQGTSTGTAFTNAISSSSCVPDAYADTSAVEDFAQVNVLFSYQTLVGALPANPACLQPQLNVFSSTARLNQDLTDTACIASVRPSKRSYDAELNGLSAFAANLTAPITSTATANHAQYSASVVKSFKEKYGSSRNAPASGHMNNTAPSQPPFNPPTYKKVAPPS